MAAASVFIAAACILFGRRLLAHVDGSHPYAADEGAAVLVGRCVTPSLPRKTSCTTARAPGADMTIE